MPTPTIQSISFDEAFKKGYLTFFCISHSDLPDDIYDEITPSQSYALYNRERRVIPVSPYKEKMDANFFITATLSTDLGKPTVGMEGDGNRVRAPLNKFVTPCLEFENDDEMSSFQSESEITNGFSDINQRIRGSFDEVYEFIFSKRVQEPKKSAWDIVNEFVFKKVKPVKYSRKDTIIKYVNDHFDEDEYNAYYKENYTIEGKDSYRVRVPDKFLTYEILEGPLHCISLPTDFKRDVISGESVDNVFKYREVEVSLAGFLEGDIRTPKYRLMPSNPKDLRGWYVIPYHKHYTVENDARVISIKSNFAFFKTKEDAISFRNDAIDKMLNIIKSHEE